MSVTNTSNINADLATYLRFLADCLDKQIIYQLRDYNINILGKPDTHKEAEINLSIDMVVYDRSFFDELRKIQ